MQSFVYLSCSHFDKRIKDHKKDNLSKHYGLQTVTNKIKFIIPGHNTYYLSDLMH